MLGLNSCKETKKWQNHKGMLGGDDNVLYIEEYGLYRHIHLSKFWNVTLQACEFQKKLHKKRILINDI